MNRHNQKYLYKSSLAKRMNWINIRLHVLRFFIMYIVLIVAYTKDSIIDDSIL